MEPNSKDDFTIIETFVGCGNSYIGFKNNGFKTIFVSDMGRKLTNIKI